MLLLRYEWMIWLTLMLRTRLDLMYIVPSKKNPVFLPMFLRGSSFLIRVLQEQVSFWPHKKSIWLHAAQVIAVIWYEYSTEQVFKTFQLNCCLCQFRETVFFFIVACCHIRHLILHGHASVPGWSYCPAHCIYDFKHFLPGAAHEHRIHDSLHHRNESLPRINCASSSSGKSTQVCSFREK
jgi:hypothetical protein